MRCPSRRHTGGCGRVVYTEHHTERVDRPTAGAAGAAADDAGATAAAAAATVAARPRKRRAGVDAAAAAAHDPFRCPRPGPTLPTSFRTHVYYV